MNGAEGQVGAAGYVLAGGKSSRMGRNKAFLELHGEPLIRIAARVMEAAAGSATIVGDPAIYGQFGYRAIPDIYPGEGPLGGILTALRDTASDYILVTACDMPAIPEEFLRRLLAAAADAAFDVLIPLEASGRRQPLCAVYHARALPGLEAAFAAGTRRVLTALETVNLVPFPVMESACFQNVNTPEDWAAYAAN